MHLIINTTMITLALGSSLHAAELHVAPTGDDSHPGTAAAPFKTVQAAVDRAGPGDTVLVGKGIYREFVTCTTSGTESQRLVIKASPRRAAILQGVLIKASHITFEGFQITNGFSSWIGEGVEAIGDYIDIVDNYIFEIKRYGLEAHGLKNRVLNNKIHMICQGLVASGTNYLIENNEISRIYNYGYLDGDYARFFGDDAIWRGNFLHGNLPSEKAGHPDGFQTFDDNGEHVRNILFEGNIVGNTTAATMIQSWYSKESRALTFRNNVFFDLVQGVNAGVPDSLVENNTFYNVRSYGIIGPNVKMRNNLFYNCKSASGSEYSLYYKVAQKKVSGGSLADVDPMFVDADNLNFRLKPGSPAIDAGDPTSPVPAGGGSRIDIGAYEFIAPTSGK